MDENDPENAPSMLSYLLREQYGDWPLLYGPYYNAPTKSQRDFKSGDPVYIRDEKNFRYVVADDRKNSIPTYEEEFCTIFPRMWSSQSHHEAAYRYWGNVAEYNKKKVIENPSTGEPETVEVPTFRANLTFFFKYQVWYMYWRYFMWNFSGRQNDVQGLLNNTMEGNWITGIKFIDDILLGEDSSKVIHRDKNNFAHNRFYMLPFLLGLIGAILHFRRKFSDAWVVFVFFFMTGLAIVIYLNQTPYQPRERDYSYAGSFYAFAIWIGLGVVGVYEWIKEKIKNESLSLSASLLCFFVPYIMGAEGWDDHDRSLRTLARDTAINYLESCAPNAILFTNGDNDTFPLWYAQEVEGIRTDVRVVNLSLLQTDWYINQMRRKAYKSDPVPFTIPPEKYLATRREVIYLIEKDEKGKPMDLKKALEFALSDDPRNKIDNGMRGIDYIPARSFEVPVDKNAVLKHRVVSEKDTARIVSKMSFRIPKGYITKNDLMILDLVAHNDWSRPIYFAVTTGNDAYIGLEKYFQLEGMAYRLVPVEESPLEQSMGGRVNTEAMYKNITEKFRWGGADKKGINFDENCVRIIGNFRMQMGILAHALINEGKSKKAEEILDLCLKVMPDENIPFDASMFSVCAAYYQIGKLDKANALSKKLFDIFEGDIRIYESLKPHHRPAFFRDTEQAKELLRRLYYLARDFRQTELQKDYMNRLKSILTPEELATDSIR
jgi:tetratricopeptide (TPR) repeat protein